MLKLTRLFRKFLRNLLIMFTKFLQTLTASHNTKMVIIIRTDLQMGRGKIASQAAHVAVSLYKLSVEKSSPFLESWLHFGQPKIVLKVDDNCEETLKTIYETALQAKLNACLVRDAGRSQVSSGTVTSVGIGPNKVEDVDRITGGLKLL